jgi:ribosomal protein S18 acetylase RimI-like enzyme
MVDMVNLRDATLADMPALASVFRRSSLSNDGDRPNLLAHPEVLEYGDEWVRAGYVRAAEIDSVVVGFITGVPSDDGEFLEVEDMFTDPEWMRRGVATALVRDLVERARERGAVRLEVTGNFHAKAFYESVGFVAGETVATRWDTALRMRLAVD